LTVTESAEGTLLLAAQAPLHWLGGSNGAPLPLAGQLAAFAAIADG
jgi:hypothetical protein